MAVVAEQSPDERGEPRPTGPTGGKPTFEDTSVQRAVAMRLEAIDAQDFHDCSYGFRPGRSPHAALHAWREQCLTEGIGWIVDADVRGSCDSIDRTRLREVLRQRVNDGRIVRLMGKWLRAGVMEEGELSHPETGVVQGGVISPVLAHVFLPQVLDEWFAREVRPRMQGRGFLLRLADDVRHITRRWIPFPERRGSEDKTSGSAAHLEAKAEGNSSMPSKRNRSEDAYGLVPQDPRDRVRAELLESQFPAMEAYIPRLQRLLAGSS